MNLYLVRQSVNKNYDTFDSFVCSAENEEQARNMQPCIYNYAFDEKRTEYMDGFWCDPIHVKVKYIGIADKSILEVGIIVSSFNAG